MLVLGSWLREFVPFKESYEEVAHALTMAGLEVEGLYEAFKDLKQGVVSVVVESVEPIPGSSKLKKVVCFDGETRRTVVCGAPNVREGMLCPLVVPGTPLPGGVVVEEKEIMGVASSGMLASQQEILTGEDGTGIWDLGELGVDGPGKRLKEFFPLDDWVFEIGITPNRADCLSVLGVSREVSAIYKIPIEHTIYQDGARAGKGRETEFPVTIEAPQFCMRYMASIIKGVSVGESPVWLKKRLLAMGVRPINNVVDCTNYCLLELGQPLHAFDLALLKGPAIRVRTALDGERLVTLDGKERELTKEMLVIADSDRPVAVAGVMGGANSEVSQETSDILLESAWFEPNQIRRTRRALKLSTEASYRFERGVDPVMVEVALRRCAHMICELCGGTIEGEVDVYPRPYEPRSVAFRPDRVSSLIGLDIPGHEQVEILEGLGLRAKENSPVAQGDYIEVEVPSFRHDIREEIDIVEEVARLKGFSEIPTLSPRGELIHSFTQDEAIDFIKGLKDIFSGQGVFEIISYSFCSKRELDALGYPADHPARDPVEILNPLTEEQAVMRTNLLPSILQAVKRNFSRMNMNLRLFEIGRRFLKDNASPTGVREEDWLACAVTGKRFDEHWAWQDHEVDVFDVKGLAENCLRLLRVDGWRFIQDSALLPPYFQEQVASLCVDKTGRSLGAIGELKGEVLEAWEIERPVFYLEFDVAALMASPKRPKEMEGLPRYPASYRDVAMILDESISYGEIAQFIASRKETLLEDFFIFDVYKGKPVPKGKKSIALRFIYRAKDHTLTDEEVAEVHERLVGSLLEHFKGELRS